MAIRGFFNADIAIIVTRYTYPKGTWIKQLKSLGLLSTALISVEICLLARASLL